MSLLRGGGNWGAGEGITSKGKYQSPVSEEGDAERSILGLRRRAESLPWGLLVLSRSVFPGISGVGGALRFPRRELRRPPSF